MVRNGLVGLVIACMCTCPARAQLPADVTPNHDVQSEPEPLRILGIVPNYRTSASLEHDTPIAASEKFAIARPDSFDRGTVILGALLGGEAQLTKSTPSFGQVLRPPANTSPRLTAILYLTEAIFPTLQHQDPRYFRLGTGNV